MSATRRVLEASGLAAGVVGAVAASAPDTALGRAARRAVGRVAHDLQYAASAAPGIVYRLSGRRPDPEVSDDVLADRIRSSIGPLEQRLDVPHVHVMVEDHVALLHGEVPDAGVATSIERAVSRISGVRGVESHLHVGMIPGDTRPSEGATTQPSAARRALVGAARDAGAVHQPEAAVHAVLCGLFDRIPVDERADVLVHLPQDVRELVGSMREARERQHVKRLSEFVALIVGDGGVPPATAELITRAVLTALRDLVPEEAADIAAVLPTELRQVWQSAMPELEPAE